MPFFDFDNKPVSCFCCFSSVWTHFLLPGTENETCSFCSRQQILNQSFSTTNHLHSTVTDDISDPELSGWTRHEEDADVRHTCTCPLLSWGVQGQLDNTVFRTTEQQQQIQSSPEANDSWALIGLISNWFQTDTEVGGACSYGTEVQGGVRGGRVIQPYAGGLDTQMSWHLNPAIRYWLFHMCVTLPQELGQSNEPFRWGRGRIHTEPEQVCFSVKNSDLLKPPLMVDRHQRKKSELSDTPVHLCDPIMCPINHNS